MFSKLACSVGCMQSALREIVFSVVFLHDTLHGVCVYTNGVKMTKVKNRFSVFIIEAFIMLSLLDGYTGYCNNLKWLHCKHTNKFVLCWYIVLCSIDAGGCSNWCDGENVRRTLSFCIFLGWKLLKSCQVDALRWKMAIFVSIGSAGLVINHKMVEDSLCSLEIIAT